MSFTQLDPPIPIHVIDKGAGFAFAVIGYGRRRKPFAGVPTGDCAAPHAETEQAH